MANQKYIKFEDDNSYRIIDYGELIIFYPPNTFIPLEFKKDEERKLFSLYERIPSNDDVLKKVVKKGEPYSVDDYYMQEYEIVDITPEEKAELVKNKILEVKLKKSDFLKETDWVVLFYYEKGIEMPEVWKKYRQDIRDLNKTITEDNFLNFQWPEMPPMPSTNLPPPYINILSQEEKDRLYAKYIGIS